MEQKNLVCHMLLVRTTEGILKEENQGFVKGEELCLNPYLVAWL